MALTLRETWLAEQHAEGDAANHVCRNATAKQRQRSALWEDKLQHFNDQLNPGVFLDWQDGNDLRAGSHKDGNSSSSCGVHRLK